MTKTALITGATAGIGLAIAQKFAHNGFNIIINGRRSRRLQDLAKQLKEECDAKILTLPFDIRNKNKVNEAISTLPEKWKKIDVLINNAGLAAGLNHLQDGNTDDWDQMIDTNVKGLLYATKAILPSMMSRNSGHIINIGSIAGKEVYPKGNVYCATKFAVDALTKGLRIDLMGTGIKISQVSPGLVETEFSSVRFKGNEKRADMVYHGYQPLEGNDIADIVFYLTTLPPHVCINDLVVTPMAQPNAYLLDRKM